MREDKGAMKSSGKENQQVVENGKKKTKEERPATKVVVRRLPPTMTEEQFKMQVSPLPDVDYFYFVPADMTLTPNAFSRAYINFVDQTDLFIFTQKFDGYVFIDSKGGEFPAVVEFAPFQRIPKNRPNRKKDPKVGTIESDPTYMQFKEYLEAVSLENRTSANVSKQHFFETSLENEKKEINNTPLLDYIKNKRAERQRIRDEKREEKRKRDLERKKAKEEQRRTKKEDDTSVLKVLNNQNVSSKERVREKDVKPSYVKKKLDDVKLTPKEKSSSESRSKDSKVRTGKSYLEERQRQAERREEQRKKLTQTQSSTSGTDAKSSSSDNKTVVNEENLAEEDPRESEVKAKESDYKKPERPFKREESRRSSYKYETKRDKDVEDTRRPRRTNERSYQNSRRDEDRPEDNSRKRYSETRRNQDTPRERYKEKERNKNHGLRKTSGSKADTVKVKSKSETNKEENGEDKEIVETNLKEDNDQTSASHNYSDSNEIPAEENVSSELEGKSKKIEFSDKTKSIRRKSFEYDKNRQPSSITSGRSSNREKYSEKKRRNSVGSTKPQESSDPSDNKNKDVSNAEIKESPLTTSENPAKEGTSEFESKIPLNEDALSKKDSMKNNFETEEKCIPKRRNSTGERVSPDKLSSRRNSLGSEDKLLVYDFDNKEPKNDITVISKDNNKEEKKQHRNSRDPRTERRIRNKDRPSLEIYRPGMGKFSKQRLEREKGLGSSTEVESPSSSPSPTPVMKHKILSGSQH